MSVFIVWFKILVFLKWDAVRWEKIIIGVAIRAAGIQLPEVLWKKHWGEYRVFLGANEKYLKNNIDL